MTAVNDITRNKIQTKPPTHLYDKGWDLIFGNGNTVNDNTSEDIDKEEADNNG